MGYKVEHRAVDIGEDLSSYDHVICFLSSPNQLVSVKFYNGLYAIYARPDSILAYDDWQIKGIYESLLKCKDESKLYADFILNVTKSTREELSKYSKEFLKAIDIIESFKNKILISAFDNSHIENSDGLSLLFKNLSVNIDNVYTYNPNPYHRNRTPKNFGNEGDEDPDYVESFLDLDFCKQTVVKRRRFNFASLVQSKTKKWLNKQGAVFNKTVSIKNWPVDLYGSKSIDQDRLTEGQMCLVFEKDWGCLLPSYDHAGSGWWRARYQQCADACIKNGYIMSPRLHVILWGNKRGV
jgi:hypothetical protein